MPSRNGFVTSDDLDLLDAKCLVLLDRAGWATVDQITAALWQTPESTVQRRLQRLEELDAVGRQRFPSSSGTKPHALYLTARGWQALKPFARPEPWYPVERHDLAPEHPLEHFPDATGYRRPRVRDTWEAVQHDLGTTASLIALSQAFAALKDDEGDPPLVTWRREVSFAPAPDRNGNLPVISTMTRYPVDMKHKVVDGDRQLQDERERGTHVAPRILRPDGLIEVWWSDGLRQDILVEFDHKTNRISNRAKFDKYDAFLSGWYLTLPRYQRHAPPVLVFVCASGARLGPALADANNHLRISIFQRPEYRTAGYPARQRSIFTTLGHLLGSSPDANDQSHAASDAVTHPIEGSMLAAIPDGVPRACDIGKYVLAAPTLDLFLCGYRLDLVGVGLPPRPAAT